MKIGVVSDSHGNLFMLDKALSAIGDVDLLIHLGDHYKDAIKVNSKYMHELVYVPGNNDYSGSIEVERLIDIGGKKIFITHGHRENVSFGLMQLEYKAREQAANIVLFGHTHKYYVDEYNGVFFLNPGSVARPRDVCSSAAILGIDDKGQVFARKIVVEY